MYRVQVRLCANNLQCVSPAKNPLHRRTVLICVFIPAPKDEGNEKSSANQEYLHSDCSSHARCISGSILRAENGTSDQLR